MFYLFYFTGLLIWSLVAVMAVMLTYQALWPSLVFRYHKLRDKTHRQTHQEYAENLLNSYRDQPINEIIKKERIK